MNYGATHWKADMAHAQYYQFKTLKKGKKSNKLYQVVKIIE